MFTAKLTHRHAALGLTQDRPFRPIALQSPAGQRMICAAVYLPVFIQNLLMHRAEKIPPVQPLTFGGEYRHKYDHQFKAETELREVKASLFTGSFSGGGKVKLSVGDITLKSMLEGNSSRLRFTTHRTSNAPFVSDSFSGQFDKDGGLDQINVPFRSSLVPQKYIKAIFKLAFLFAFALLGYRYCLSPGGRAIRAQILNPNQDTFPTVTLKFAGPIPDGICINKQPDY